MIATAGGATSASTIRPGDYPWVVALRRGARDLSTRVVATTSERARDEASVAWIGDHRDALLIGGVLGGLVLLWVADLSWAGLLLVLGLVAVFETAVYRIAARPATAAATFVTARSFARGDAPDAPRAEHGSDEERT